VFAKLVDYTLVLSQAKQTYEGSMTCQIVRLKRKVGGEAGVGEDALSHYAKETFGALLLILPASGCLTWFANEPTTGERHAQCANVSP
jgi:hypothetical protein